MECNAIYVRMRNSNLQICILPVWLLCFSCAWLPGAIDKAELRRLLWDTGYSVNRQFGIFKEVLFQSVTCAGVSWRLQDLLKQILFVSRVSLVSRDTLDEIFEEVDKDKSGSVELKELGPRFATDSLDTTWPVALHCRYNWLDDARWILACCWNVSAY